PDYPLIEESRWHQVLQEYGFAVRLTLSDAVNPESVIVAQSEPESYRNETDRVLITGDPAIGKQLVKHIIRQGSQAEFIAQPEDNDTGDSWLAASTQNTEDFHWLHIPRNADFSPDSFLRQCNQFIQCYQSLMLNCADKVRRISLLTQGAQSPERDSGTINLTHSGLLGLGKTLSLEQQDIPCVRIDMDANSSISTQLPLVTEKLLCSASEPEMALRNNQWWLPRLSLVQDHTASASPGIKAGHTYLVTGAFGGLGKLLVEWLAKQGATHIALLSRSADQSKVDTIYGSLADKVELRCFAANVGNAEESDKAIQQISNEMPPLKGVFHSAMVLRDQMLQTLDTETLQAVMPPKVAGAWNLHRSTLRLSLDHFVMFSSAAAMLGNPGQGAYSAANYFMDQLAYWRHQQNLPAQSINWGVWKSVGKAEELGIEAHFLRAAPWLGPLEPQQGMSALATILSHPEWVQRGVFSIDPESLQPHTLGLNIKLYQSLTEQIQREDHSLPRQDQELSESSTDIEAGLIAYCTELMGLAVNELRASDNLLEKGFDSLMATRLATLIKQTWPVSISLRDIFEMNQVKAIADFIRQGAQGTRLDVIPATGSDQPAPLTSTQQRCWFFDKLSPNSDFYNVTGGFLINGDLKADLWQQSINRLVQRHHILQTVFKEDTQQNRMSDNDTTESVLQVVKNLPPDYELLDLSREYAETGKHSYLSRFYQEAATPFDLKQGPLLRCRLLYLQPKQHAFIINMHHIISDGWSLGVMMKELSAIYTALMQGREPDLAPLPIQFSDYAVWLANRTANNDFSQQKAYWQEQLHQANTLLEFPQQKPRPETQSYRGSIENFTLDARLTEDLLRFANSQNCTLFMVLATVFNTLVMGYTGRKDILIGSAFANRERPELASLIGFLSNTWVLRTQLQPHEHFGDVLERVRTHTLAAYEHQDAPFEQIVELINPSRSLAYSPLIQVMFILQKSPQAELQVPGLDFQELDRCYQASKFDFTVSLIENKSGMRGWIEYNTDLFSRDFMQHLVANFVNLSRAVCEYPHTELGQLITQYTSLNHPRHYGFRSAAHSSQDSLLEGQLNRPTDALILADRLDEQFRLAANAHPDTTIEIYRDKTRKTPLTLGDLRREAEVAAHEFVTSGLQGAPVILVIRDRRQYFIHFWGAILAGCKPLTIAYPGTMEPHNPVIKKLINACRILQGALVLTDGEAERFNHLFSMSSVTNVKAARLDQRFPAIDITRLAESSDQVAFYQLSSGSTGASKCIPITFAGIRHHMVSNCQVYAYATDGKSLNWLSMDHVVPLLTFHIRDVLMGRDQVQVDTKTILSDPLVWFELLEREQASETWAPNFAYQLMINADRETNRLRTRHYNLSHVRQFMNAGEQVTSSVSEQFTALLARHQGNPRVYMPAYGSAETCTVITHAEEPVTCRPHRRSAEFISMGTLLPGTKARVVDANHQLLPQGHIGYLQIQSPCLTPGYINAPQANKDTFIDNWYHTGDLGFIDAGELYLCGRDKDQLVINGINISCQEIEAQLNTISGIKRPFLVAFGAADHKSGSESVVIAFAPSDSGTVATTARHIQTTIGKDLGLPVAAVFTITEQDYPQTTSGKLQRNQLQRRFVDGEFKGNIIYQDQALEAEPLDSHDGYQENTATPDWFATVAWTQKTSQSATGSIPADNLPGNPVGSQTFKVKAIGDCDSALTIMQGTYSVETIEDLADADQPIILLQPTMASLSQDLQGLFVVLQEALAKPDHHQQCVTLLCIADRSMLLALLPVIRTLQQEEPDLQIRLLGIPDASMITALDHESWRSPSDLVTYLEKDGSRWVPVLTPDASTASPLKTRYESSEPELPDGTYLVSGGLGGIGFELCQRLLQRPGIRLVILGRQSIAQPERQQRWESLLSRGADRVQYYRCDIGDASQVNNVLSGIAEPIVGVFHLAGVLKQQPMRELNRRDLAESWHGKVNGGFNLATRLADPGLPANQRTHPLLFIHFSSVNGFFGGLHAGAYGAACGYQAALSAWQRTQGQRAYCISWSAWRNTGMSPDSGQQEPILSARGFALVEPQTAWDSLIKLLQQPPGSWLAGIDTTHAMIAPCCLADPQEPQEPGSKSPTTVQTSDITSWSNTERQLQTLWENLLNRRIETVDADFFASGGHSLLALKLLTRINQAFSVELSLTDLFQHVRLNAMAQLIERSGAEISSSENPLPQWQTNRNYPLTKPQRAIWYQYTQNNAADAYLMQGSMKVDGPLDTLAFQNAVYEIASRHTAMRLAFTEVEGIPMQRVLDEPNVSFRLIPRQVTEEQWQQLLQQEAIKPLAVDQGEAMRFCVAASSDGQTWLAVTTHHLYLDGFSIGLLFDELWEMYDALRQSGGHPGAARLPQEQRQYIQYLLKITEDTPVNLPNALDYWQQHLHNAVPAALPFISNEIAEQQAGSARFDLDPATVTDLHDIARQFNLPLNSLLTATFGLLLHFYNREPRQAFLMPVANRGNGEWLYTPGMFANVLPVVTDVRDNPLLQEYFASFDLSVKDSLKYEFLSIETLSEHLDLKAHGSHYSQLMFASQDGLQTTKRTRDLTVELRSVPAFAAKYGLTVHAEQTADSIQFIAEFAKGSVDRSSLYEFMANYQLLLSHCLQDIQSPVNELLDTLGSAIKPAVSESETIDSEQYNFLARLQQQFIERPHALALGGNGSQISFQQLDIITENIARHLMVSGVQHGDIVAALLPRNHYAICMTIAILRAGAVLLPIEDNMPRQRIRFQLTDSDCRFCLVTEDSLPLGKLIINDLPVRMIAAPTSPEAGNCQPISRDGLTGVHPDQAAYIIYTSGSSGTPKSVLVSHHNLSNLLAGLDKAIYQAHPAIERIMLTASFLFDASVQQWCTLALGKQLYILDPSIKLEPRLFSDFLQQHQIDLMDITPTLLQQMLPVLPREDSCLSAVLVGGEAISTPLWNKLHHFKYTTFYNMYGPTEATVDVSCTEIADHKLPNIGFPLVNNRISVVNAAGKPCPFGALGEILIEGDSVALGYEGSHRKAFLGRYLTGDTGWIAADGRVFICGRNDDQVKISGYRITLGEIESTLSAQPGVKQAIVSKIDVQGNPRLLASIQWQEGALAGQQRSNEQSMERLKNSCRQWLPDYMMPHFWQSLDDFPLLASGKADRKTITATFNASRQAPVETRTESGLAGEDYNNVELLIKHVFSSVLAKPDISDTDNFFSSGGDSVQTIQVAYLLRQKGISINSVDVINHPTVRALSEYINHTGTPSHNAIEAPGNRNDGVSGTNDLQLSPTQQGLLFHYLMASDHAKPGYVQQFQCRIEGELDVAAWKKSWQRILESHSVFGIAIGKNNDGQWMSRFTEPDHLEIRAEDWRNHSDIEHSLRKRANSERNTPFDLAAPPLMRMLLIRVTDNQYRFLWTFHHLLLDGWSLPVLWDELNTTYRSYCQGQPVYLKTERYQDYLDLLQGTPKAESKSYWQHYLQYVPKQITSENAEHADTEKQSVFLTLDDKLADSIASQAQACQVSKVNLIMLAWGQLMRQRLQNKDIVFGTVLSGRPETLPDMDRRVGLYINTVPVRCAWQASDRLGDCLRETALSLGNSQQHQYIGLGAIKQAAGCGANHELFDNLLTVENYPLDGLKQSPLADLSFHDFKLQEQTHYPLAMKVSIHNGISCELQHCPSRIPVEHAESLISGFERLLERIATLTPDSLLGALTPDPENANNPGNHTGLPAADFQDVFRQVLAVDHVDLNNTFISLGGDSIQAMQIASRLQARGYNVSTRQILTTNELGTLLTEAHYPDTLADNHGRQLTLTPIQTLFLGMEHANPHHWNQHITLQIPSCIDERLLKACLRKLVKRHPLMQATIDPDSHKIIPDTYSADDCIYSAERNESQELSGLVEAMHRSVDIHQGPMWRICITEANGTHLLIWVMHHLIVDGVSWRILCYELDALLHTALTGENLSLIPATKPPQLTMDAFVRKAPDKELQIVRLNNIEDCQKNRAPGYWSQIATTGFDLSPDKTHQLTELSAYFEVPVESVLVAALLKTFHQLNSQQNLSLTVEKHG
ncbi:MAG: SDR family NAD(P)-dependent oxidoreductase, partial [Ketobacteraceae bacterium]|nr:SDR family NAD(P)-dependent oxidoreductase [Ketobacteraceae bacterium]